MVDRSGDCQYRGEAPSDPRREVGQGGADSGHRDGPRIAPDRLDEFKDLAARALELTRGEEATLQYDWYFSEDETKCVVRETYANSEAVLAHMANMGDLIGQIAELGGGLEVEAFGAPSAELLEAAASLGPTVYRFFQGK